MYFHKKKISHIYHHHNHVEDFTLIACHFTPESMGGMSIQIAPRQIQARKHHQSL